MRKDDEKQRTILSESVKKKEKIATRPLILIVKLNLTHLLFFWSFTTFYMQSDYFTLT